MALIIVGVFMSIPAPLLPYRLHTLFGYLATDLHHMMFSSECMAAVIWHTFFVDN